jgi:hypothetical protein
VLRIEGKKLNSTATFVAHSKLQRKLIKKDAQLEALLQERNKLLPSWTMKTGAKAVLSALVYGLLSYLYWGETLAVVPVPTLDYTVSIGVTLWITIVSTSQLTLF